MSEVTLEKKERDPYEEFMAKMQALKEKLQIPPSYVSEENVSSEPRVRAGAESYSASLDKLSAKVERLENEIVELRNTIAAQNTAIQNFEQRLARLEIV